MHQGRDEMARAVEEGDVVRVRRDAGSVEGYEDVDGGRGRFCAFRLQGFCEVGRESSAEEVRDLDLVPGGRHAILEITAPPRVRRVLSREALEWESQKNVRAFDDEDIVFFAQSQRHATLDQLLLARLAQPIRITCIPKKKTKSVAKSIFKNNGGAGRKEFAPLLRHRILT